MNAGGLRLRLRLHLRVRAPARARAERRARPEALPHFDVTSRSVIVIAYSPNECRVDSVSPPLVL